MKNLFICHSQAQIILASGLAKGRFNKNENTLLLLKDFNLNEKLVVNLKKVFLSVIIREGLFPKKNKKIINRINIYLKDIFFLEKEFRSNFDKVFMVCDQNIQELYLIKLLKNRNKKTEFIWLEDGSYPYFLNYQNTNGLNANRITIFLRYVIFKYFFKFGFAYDFEGNYMSGNKNLKTAYLTMPNYARDIFKKKELVKITHEEYLLGIKKFYFALQDINYDYGDIIILFDKLDTYRNIMRIKEITSYIIEEATIKRKKVSFKLHPREENNSLSFLNQATELNRNLGFEFYIQDVIKNKNIKIIGFNSTSLQVAKTFNIETISLFLLTGEINKNLVDFYNRINIELPENIEKLRSYI